MNKKKRMSNDLIEQLLKEHPDGLSYKELALATGVPEPSLRRALQVMAREGVVLSFEKREALAFVAPQTKPRAIRVWRLASLVARTGPESVVIETAHFKTHGELVEGAL